MNQSRAARFPSVPPYQLPEKSNEGRRRRHIQSARFFPVAAGFAMALGLAAGLVPSSSLAESRPLLLAENGQARAVIVLSATAGEQAREAAKLLQDYLGRISGAHFEIGSEGSPASGPRILVGASAAARQLGVDVPQRWTYAMNEEEYVIRTVGQDLVLAGNERSPYRGTVFAVNDFLQRLGCRWFFPGAFGEVVPHRSTLVAPPLQVHEQPDFRFRNIWYSGWMPVQGKDGEELSVWLDRNRMTPLSGFSLPGDGTITRLAPAEKYFATHPEIYAVNQKGQRVKDMLCLTEPDAVTIAAETIKQEFRAHPEQATFGFAPPDGHPRCYCTRCEAASPNFTGKGLGEPSLSDLWFRFANAVAVEVAKEFPDRWLLTNGYANRARPPEMLTPLSPNLGIQSAMLDSCTFHPIGAANCWQRQLYRTVLDRWTAELRCVFIYDYDPGKALDGLPFPMLHNLQPDFRYFKDHGVWGFWTEGQNCWMVTHLNYYLRARLMWNARADVQALVRDYTEKFYGAAARPVEHYIWTLEDAVRTAPIHETFGRLVPWGVVYPPKLVARLDRDVDRAVRLARDGAAAEHVRVLRLAHEYLRAYLRMEAAAANADFNGAVQQADEMLQRRGELGQINPSLIPVTPAWCSKGDGALEWHRQTYRQLAERMNGVRGSLVALTPRRWQFRADPERIGQFERWYAADSQGKWEDVDSALYWEAQGRQDSRGYGYAGQAWCRTTVAVPAAAAGKEVKLAMGGLYGDEYWLWVNDRLVAHKMRPSTKTPIDVDVTGHLRAGQTNRLALLINTLPADRNARAGLCRRVFLWSPGKVD